MTITDVHTSHCCIWHGCKYGDGDCTVTQKVAPQEYPCERCDTDTEDWKDGGTERVLAARLEKEGLPPAAGLTGLLRHLDGNRALSEWFGQMLVQTQSDKIVALEDLLSYLWLYVTRHTWTQLTTDQKELFADVIDRMHAREYPEDFTPVDRWWRE